MSGFITSVPQADRRAEPVAGHQTDDRTPPAPATPAAPTAVGNASHGSHTVIQFGTDGTPAFCETLPRVPESVRGARLMVSLALNVWGLSAVRDSAVLVVSELVSNAADHASGSVVRLSVTRTADRTIRVAVSDTDRRQPSPRAAHPLDERGRGLLLVADLSEHWGVDPLPTGKTVWAELVAP